MREAVDKRQNRVAVKQQSLTFAGMGHIGQLMGADVQLLGQNLPVTVGLIEHMLFVFFLGQGKSPFL